jgi:hypothetical protein
MKPLPKNIYMVRFMRGDQFLAAQFNSPTKAEEFRSTLAGQDVYEDTILFIPIYFRPVDAENKTSKPKPRCSSSTCHSETYTCHNCCGSRTSDKCVRCDDYEG